MNFNAALSKEEQMLTRQSDPSVNVEYMEINTPRSFIPGEYQKAQNEKMEQLIRETLS